MVFVSFVVEKSDDFFFFFFLAQLIVRMVLGPSAVVGSSSLPSRVKLWPRYGFPVWNTDQDMTFPCETPTTIWLFRAKHLPRYGLPVWNNNQDMAFPCETLTNIWLSRVKHCPRDGSNSRRSVSGREYTRSLPLFMDGHGRAAVPSLLLILLLFQILDHRYHIFEGRKDLPF